MNFKELNKLIKKHFKDQKNIIITFNNDSQIIGKINCYDHYGIMVRSENITKSFVLQKEYLLFKRQIKNIEEFEKEYPENQSDNVTYVTIILNNGSKIEGLSKDINQDVINILIPYMKEMQVDDVQIK